MAQEPSDLIVVSNILTPWPVEQSHTLMVLSLYAMVVNRKSYFSFNPEGWIPRHHWATRISFTIHSLLLHKNAHAY
jgi:hypothetical protein